MPRSGKVLGTRVTDEMWGEIQDAVVALREQPVWMTKAELIRQAISRELKRLQRKHNDGEAFPVSHRQLSPGRLGGDDEGATVGKRRATRVGANAKPGRGRTKRKSGTAASPARRSRGRRRSG